MQAKPMPVQVTAPAERGPTSLVRRTGLLQALTEELPWFRFVIYRRGEAAPFIVDFGLGEVALRLDQVDMFVVGMRAANAHHTGRPATLSQITALTPPTAETPGRDHG